jgi:hypothetical protein
MARCNQRIVWAALIPLSRCLSCTCPSQVPIFLLSPKLAKSSKPAETLDLLVSSQGRRLRSELFAHTRAPLAIKPFAHAPLAIEPFARAPLAIELCATEPRGLWFASGRAAVHIYRRCLEHGVVWSRERTASVRSWAAARCVISDLLLNALALARAISV